jgi:hypothetical protein
MKVVIRYSILFWLLAYLIFCILLSSIADLQVVMIRVVFFLLPQIIVFYLNLLIFLPRFFEEKRKIAYYFWNLLYFVGVGCDFWVCGDLFG